MHEGLGSDGAVTADVVAGDRLVTTLLQAEQHELDALPEFTESPATSLWTPAPGVVVVLPERYTPTYAYPALVWLLEPGEDEAASQRRMEEISTRNYVGIGLRSDLYTGGPVGSPPANRETPPNPRGGLARFANLMRCVENWVHIDPQRTYVSGTRLSARIAVAWVLARPDWFAGAMAIDASRETTCAWRSQDPRARGRRLLWVRTETTDADDTEAMALEYLGLAVTSFQPSGNRPARSLGRKIDRWMLEKVRTAVLD